MALAQRPARIRGRKTEDAGGHDDGLSCTREIRTMFSLFARKIVADGGPPQDGAFYEVAGAGIVASRMFLRACTDIYVHT